MIKKEVINIKGRKYGYLLCEQAPFNHPVILYLHGGPGSPEYPIFQTRLDSDYLQAFNVCYYDHYGCGLSYVKKPTLTFNDLIQDVAVMATYLIQRYQVGKVLLVGHSFGSYIGIQAAYQYPELFSAYVGIAQLVNSRKSEAKIYEHLLALCQTQGDFKNVNLLRKNQQAVKDLTSHYLAKVKGRIIAQYGIGLTVKPQEPHFMIRNLLKFRIYSVKNKLEYIKGLLATSSILLPDVKEINISAIQQYKIPIYLIHGQHDYQINRGVTKTYYASINAPFKQMIDFNHSAHFPNYEEPERFNQLMLSIQAMFN